MTGRGIADIVIALESQREALATAECDPQIRDEAGYLIAEAILTLSYGTRPRVHTPRSVARS